MIENLVDDVYKHAEEQLPRECCGVALIVKGKLKYYPCENISKTDGQFVLNPKDYAEAEDKGEIVGICHSHVYYPPEPSQADKIMCEQTGLPWLIVSYPNKTYKVIEPEGYKLELVGREFCYGVADCYTIIKDYYNEIGIELSDYYTEYEWWLRGENHYEENFQKEGFVVVGDSTTQPKKHDLILMMCSSPVCNHAAVYVGDNKIIQHCVNRYSGYDIYGGYWKKSTRYVLRHESLL